jgi:stage II sporulation protein R
MYGDKTFPADYYDALILRLGEGVGDNWWCVAYPPLCFVGYDNGSESIEYRSKIVELIKKYFGE